MARETKWCQNPKCPEKKNSNQIRGSKGSKYYQSNKANVYGSGNFCTQGCYDSWSNIYLDRAIDSLGVRITEPVKVNMENAWEVKSEYIYNRGDDTASRYIYFLTNPRVTGYSSFAKAILACKTFNLDSKAPKTCKKLYQHLKEKIIF